MDVFLARRRRKSEVVPMFGVAPTPPPSTPGSSATDTPGPAAVGRSTRIKPMSWSQRNIIPEGSMDEPEATARDQAQQQTNGPRPPALPAAKSGRNLNHFARSIISLNRQQQRKSVASRDSRGEDDEDADDEDTGASANQEEAALPVVPQHDPWSHVLNKITRKASFRGVPVAASAPSPATTAADKRMSLTQVLKSREVKDLVKQAVVASHWADATSGPTRSSVMDQWVKTSQLRHTNPAGAGAAAVDEDGDSDDDTGIKSGFDVRGTPNATMYGRTLLLEESCRRAFAASGENRSQMDLQALKAWFQMTKLKITTDFERLQPAELDLLCRRMVLAAFHASEVVFRQGDEGDAMYIVFAGCVEVKVAQRVLGEKVEVTVCELTKGDYFGERALLHDDPRAATIVAKTPCELVRITRKDYNIMLKQDQQEFFSRMYAPTSSTTESIATPSSLLMSVVHRAPRATVHQQTQLEYITVLSKKKSARSKGDIDMLSEYLQTLKFFRGLPRTFVRELCTVVDFLTLAAGEYVFREGEVGDLFYIIFSGSVDVIVSSKDHRGNAQQTKLINLTEGAHFGELALMKGHGIRSATVLTREETRFLVICEKDYNATLRRMQKEDLAKRVGVLDRIPMFQTPEWTGDLLKEMSYVLSEQKLATGSVLFRQGDKAQQVYFVVRGELVVTKEIQDPALGHATVVVVERIGRDRVVGDDAAAGANFNEAIYREVTVTASTPVELLVLSKYDVFHRLSRAARETLRAAAHSHVESVVYLDRFHKTIKWDAFKQKLLQDHLDMDRLRKILPPPRKSHTASDNTQSPPPTANATQSQLVDANEFLLLPPAAVAVNECFPQHERSLARHVTAFNADAPPRPASRDQQLATALHTERRRKVAILREGNPLAYFDLHAVQQQQRQQQAEMRSRSASARRLQLKADRRNNSKTNVASPEKTARETSAMNQFFQDNFIFSQPEKPVPRRRQRHRLVRPSERLPQPQEEEEGREDGAEDGEGSHSRLDAARRLAESLCIGDTVALCVKHDAASTIETRGFSPTFRLLRCCESVDHAKTSVRLESIDADPATFAVYTVPRRKFALMPRAGRTRVKEEALQRAVADKFGRSTDPNSGSIFASIDRVVVLPTSASSSPPPPEDIAPLRMFAVVSMVLSKRELETAFCDDPLLGVHALLPSEAEAMDHALHMPLQALKNALLCILPVGEWIRFDEAYDWCVQIETDRRDKHPPLPSAPSLSSPSTRRKTGSIAGLHNALASSTPSGPKAEWQVDKEKAQRLHQFVCSRMGIKTTQDKDKDVRRNGGDAPPLATGFTPRPTVTLEEKLATLQDYLDTTTPSPLGAKNNALMMGKYRQMKRFGSILRSRISSSTLAGPVTPTALPTGTVPTNASG